MASKPEENNPIERFLFDARRLLVRDLRPEQIDPLIAEARDHLVENAADLVGRGSGEADAAASAVRAFGSPREWAREIVRAGYGGAQAGRAQQLAVAAFALLLAYSIAMTLAPTVWIYSYSTELRSTAVVADELQWWSLPRLSQFRATGATRPQIARHQDPRR